MEQFFEGYYSSVLKELAMNPKNSMEVIKSMSRQIAVATKHIELLTQE
jgi:hypothetical protein